MSLRSVIATDVKRCRVLAELDHGSTSPVAVVRGVTFYPGLHGVVAYRLSHAARMSASPAPVRLVMPVLAILLQRFMTPICGVEMSAQAHVGPGLFINHLQGVVVGSIEAGANLTLSRGTTLGRATGGGRHGTLRLSGAGRPGVDRRRAGSFGNVVHHGMDVDPSRAASLARWTRRSRTPRDRGISDRGGTSRRPAAAFMVGRQATRGTSG